MKRWISQLAGTTLRHRLSTLVIVALLPAIILTALALAYLAVQQKADAENASAGTLRALLSAIDTELARSVGAAETLAASRRLDTDDIAGFHADARRVLVSQPNWTTIILLPPDGSLLMNATEPLNAKLPGQANDRESFDKALTTRMPAIGRMFSGEPSKAHVFTIRVPVVRRDKVAYVVSVTIRPDAIRDILIKQNVRRDAVVSVIDGGGTIVARSRSHDDFVGKAPSPDFWKTIQADDEGWVASRTLDGIDVQTAYMRSNWSGWRMIYGVPTDALYGSSRRSSLIVMLGMLLSLGMGIGAAAFFANRIASPIGRLRFAAQALGAGDPVELPPSNLDEVNALSKALQDAAASRQRGELALIAALQEARAARDEAQIVSRNKDHFLAMLGHELRNPLAPIANSLEVMRLQGDDPRQNARAREIITRQLANLTRLVDDLLDISRVTRGIIELKKAPVDFRDLIDSALEICRPLIDRKHQQLDVDRPGEALVLDADRSRVLQAVSNVLNNAAKYTGDGGRIAVSLRREGGEVVLAVRDNGSGLTPQEQNHIFDLFYQGENARGSDGLGLGLALADKIVRLHGGSITVSSEGRGKGSEVVFRFPITPAV